MTDVPDVDRVRLLLETAYSYLPPPKTWTGNLVRLHAIRGEHRTTKVECPRCHGEKQLGGKPCEPCEGNGFLLVDEYTRDEVSKTVKAEVFVTDYERRKTRRKNQDRELAVMEAQAAELADPKQASAYGWERARDRLHGAGSYRELLRVLEHLRDVDGALHALVDRHLVQESIASTDAGVERHLARACEWIAERMPKPIRVPPWVLEQSDVDNVRKRVGELLKDGLPTGEIATLTGISQWKVRRLAKAYRREVAA